jgi:uncharacterized protein (TIGR03086 family)
MPEAVDLAPAAAQMRDLVSQIGDAALRAPTPCAEFALTDLLRHVDEFAVALAAAARKEPAPAGTPGAAPAAPALGADWRTRIPEHLDALVDAWRDPAAFEGTTTAGGLELPAAVAAGVALEELVVHGWDVARTIGAPFTCDDTALEAVAGLLQQFNPPPPDGEAGAGGAGGNAAYAPPRDVGTARPMLTRVIALSGRDPDWSAP